MDNCVNPAMNWRTFFAGHRPRAALHVDGNAPHLLETPVAGIASIRMIPWRLVNGIEKTALLNRDFPLEEISR